MKLHVNWGRASDQQSKRVLVDSDAGRVGLINFADEAPQQCEVCRLFEKVLHLPIAGTSTASYFQGELQMDLLFLDDVIASRAINTYPKYFLLIPARPKAPLGRWDGPRSVRIAIFGRPRWIQMEGNMEFG